MRVKREGKRDRDGKGGEKSRGKVGEIESVGKERERGGREN